MGHDGSLVGGAKAAAAVAAVEAAGDQTVDDMEPNLHSPSYARSSDMYTHVGTVPRGQRQRRSSRALKEKKKKREGEEKEVEEEEGEKGVSGGQSQCKAGEHVRDSPLLSALSSLSLTSLNGPLYASAPSRLLPSTPTPKRASPLTSAPENRLSDPLGDPVTSRDAPSGGKDALEAGGPVSRPSDMATGGSRAASTQDLYVPMDPITEAARSHVDEQKKGRREVTGSQEHADAKTVCQEVASVDR